MGIVEISCRSGRKYSLEAMSAGEVVIYSDTTGEMFLVVECDGRWLHGMDVFDSIAREFSVMRTLLEGVLADVTQRGEALVLVPDSTCYDGRGVELPLQFGYMTGGRMMNLNGMEIEIEPARICVDVSASTTICCTMRYRRGETVDSRVLRLGSGTGFCEAIANATKRIGGMLDDMQDIEETLYERLCVSDEWSGHED